MLYNKFHKVGNDSADITIVSNSDTGMVHTSSLVSDLKKCHLDGSRLFNLDNLSNAIKTISKHSVMLYMVELIGEVH